MSKRTPEITVSWCAKAFPEGSPKPGRSTIAVKIKLVQVTGESEAKLKSVKQGVLTGNLQFQPPKGDLWISWSCGKRF